MVMNSNAASKWQLRLAVVLIFVVGFIAGALAMNVYRGRQRAFSRANGHGRFEQVLDKLNLSPEQRTQVGAIFDDARAQLTEVRKESEPKFREVRERADQRLKAVLTPELWEQFQQVTNDSRERRQHRRGRENRR
jgi:Spy/CpxP family protein refolding chaperone